MRRKVAHPLGILDLGRGRGGRRRILRRVLLLGQGDDAGVGAGTARVGRGLVGLLFQILNLRIEPGGGLNWH
jgi:hypothetical protein